MPTAKTKPDSLRATCNFRLTMSKSPEPQVSGLTCFALQKALSRKDDVPFPERTLSGAAVGAAAQRQIGLNA